MLYRILADIIVTLHLIWVLFMLGGFILTLCGFFWKKFFDKWIFRTFHLLGILLVGTLTVTDRYCPLTIWENMLRLKYDPSLTYPGSFIIHYVKKLVYPGVNPLVVQMPTIFIAVITVLVFIIKPPAKIKKLWRWQMA